KVYHSPLFKTRAGTLGGSNNIIFLGALTSPLLEWISSSTHPINIGDSTLSTLRLDIPFHYSYRSLFLADPLLKALTLRKRRGHAKTWNLQASTRLSRAEFKGLAYLMILIPVKMNSPDYEDFIDMFSFANPNFILPPTRGSFSAPHEASWRCRLLDSDYLPVEANLPFPNAPLRKDSVEQSTVFLESPLHGSHGTIYASPDSPGGRPLVLEISPWFLNHLITPVKKGPRQEDSGP
ncbi:hypothetical protein TNCV_4417291, partial [Trichonephila clavipes]